MKNLKKFENFVNDSNEKEELVQHLSTSQDVYDLHDLESMNVDQLRNLHDEVKDGAKEDGLDHEETSELEFESKKWIKDAIKKPGALRRKLHKGKGEKISSTEIDSELQALKSKDRDKSKPGLQLGKRDKTKHKELVLAKTLKGMR
jgi:hypothetical protein